jgi:hypothetical protein
VHQFLQERGPGQRPRPAEEGDGGPGVPPSARGPGGTSAGGIGPGRGPGAVRRRDDGGRVVAPSGPGGPGRAAGPSGGSGHRSHRASHLRRTVHSIRNHLGTTASPSSTPSPPSSTGVAGHRPWCSRREVRGGRGLPELPHGPRRNTNPSWTRSWPPTSTGGTTSSGPVLRGVPPGGGHGLPGPGHPAVRPHEAHRAQGSPDGTAPPRRGPAPQGGPARTDVEPGGLPDPSPVRSREGSSG